MGMFNLKDVDVDELQNSSNSGSSGSSSSSGSDSGPRTKSRLPYLTIYYWEEGDEWEARKYPLTSAITFEYKEGDYRIQNHLKQRKWIVWSQNEWDLIRGRIREAFDVNPDKLVRDDPEELLRAIKYVQKNKNPSKADTRPKCQFCGDRHNYLSGNWARVNNRIVCMRHTVKELHENGILD